VELALKRPDGSLLATRCTVADSPRQRARGLLGRDKLEPGEGLYLATSSIHTHFMRFPIDAVFVDGDMQVVRIRHSVKPWRFAFRRGAEGVIELEAGTCERAGLGLGERLALVDRATAEGAEQNGRTIRVAIGTRDRRFGRVAGFLLSRNGFIVDDSNDPAGLAELLGRGGVDVVLLDAGESLAGAARTARAFEALAPDVGVVLAVNDESPGGPSAGDLATVPKWGSFDAVIEALERSFATTRLDG
jgi:uncharacterized membrane protein (UPF0127 family)